MQVISATTDDAEAGLEVIFRDDNWLVARATSSEIVLKYLDCADCLAEATSDARDQSRWIVERHGVLVARWNDNAKLVWKEPELIEIAAHPTAWKILPLWSQAAIWSRLLALLQGNEPLAHDRPEIRRLAEATFRARVVRADGALLEELIQDCPFWSMNRDELLEQDPSELRLWHSLLRQPNKNVRPGIRDFVRALHHAAGLIRATTNPDEG